MQRTFYVHDAVSQAKTPAIEESNLCQHLPCFFDLVQPGMYMIVI